MRVHGEKYKTVNLKLSDEQLSVIRYRILAGDSLLTIAKDMGIRHDIVCAAAEEVIKELKSPGYVPEITEAELYKYELPQAWRLPECIKAPKNFKGLKIINTFEKSS